MKRAGVSLVIVALALASVPSFAADRTLIELQTQVQTLLQMQQKTSEDMGALRDKINALVQQTTVNLSQVSAAVDKMEKSMQQQQASTDSCVDQLAGQTQPVHDELTELRSRIDAIAKQLSDLRQASQTNAARPAVPGQQQPVRNPAEGAVTPAKGPGLEQ